MSDKVVVQTSGISFASLLTAVFVALKLTGHITWSWVWVLSPLWISFALGMSFMLMFMLFMFLIFLISGKR